VADQVMTVRGPIDADDLGFTLPHEHIFFDTTAWFVEPTDERKRRIGAEPVSPATLEDLRRDPVISRENLTFDDLAIAIDEVRLYKEAGGVTIIDQTPPEMVRRPDAVRKVSEATGVNIVMGTGHYMKTVHTPDVAEKSRDELAAWMIEEIRNGIDGTDIRPGLIGEIGLSGEVEDDEWKVLLAAVDAQVETGLPLSIHPPVPYGTDFMRIIKEIERAGSDLSRVIMCHMYHSFSRPDLAREVADTGVLLEYDRFGCEFYWESWPEGPWDDRKAAGGYREPRDYEVVDAVTELIRDGYADRILLSHDIAYRIQLHHYGGHGWDHVANHVLRYFRDRDVSESDIEKMTVGNPRRLFAVPADS
jgi:phosphotriesterase-related protein